MTAYPEYPFPRISLIICTLNEEENLPSVLSKIPVWVDEIVVVDGHSTDRTVEVARKLKPEIKLFYQPGRGKGDALKYGVAMSQGDVIVTLDADGTYPPEEMQRFVRAVLKGNDFAKGTRFKGIKPAFMPARRQFGNKILVRVCNMLFGTKYTDICSGYNAFLKESFRKINLVSDGFEMEQELFVKAAKNNFRVTEVPHSYANRVYGSSKTQDFKQGAIDLLWIISLLFHS